jgi:GrpB-like predicted nucleotidyltransferase (UPF0157 family)
VIEIVPYDSTWPAAFLEERRRLSAVLGPLAVRIEHHGSTAVPGLAAKPIIDIQVSIESLHAFHRFILLLAPLEYVHVPHADDARCPFLHRPAAWPHTHHLHLVEAGSDEESATLVFRDYLRSHPEAAVQYARLKQTLAARFRGDTPDCREAYAVAKGDFVRRMTVRGLHP